MPASVDEVLEESGVEQQSRDHLRSWTRGINPYGRALCVGPGMTPLVYFLAARGMTVEVSEIHAPTRRRIARLARRFRLDERIQAPREMNDICAAALPQDTYDVVTALSILDLVGERAAVYEKLLRSAKDRGFMAVCHYDLGVGTREQNNTANHATSLGYSLEDMRMAVDEGHPQANPRYTRDSTLFRVYKRDAPGSANGKQVSTVADILLLFASLR